MEKHLTSKKTSKLAIEKGFTEFSGLILDLEENKYLCQCLKITQSLLQKWLRDRHNIHISIVWKEKDFDIGHWIFQVIGNFVHLFAIILKILTLNLVWFDFELNFKNLIQCSRGTITANTHT